MHRIPAFGRLTMLGVVPVALLLGGCSPMPPTSDRSEPEVVPAPPPTDPVVRFETAQGPIDIEVFSTTAPISAANFLAYVDAGHYSGATFYRTVRDEHGRGGDPDEDIQVVQGGLLADELSGRIEEGPPPPLPPIQHETAETTELLNERGTISYARLDPGTASSEFFFNMKDNPALDFGDTRRQPDGQGYAVFGRVVRGMEVLERIQALPTQAEASIPTLAGQILEEPVVIERILRVE